MTLQEKHAGGTMCLCNHCLEAGIGILVETVRLSSGSEVSSDGALADLIPASRFGFGIASV
uniref:Uncharacterized protein n=1 Tax=Gibberella zeae TaxID=5518 RepID=A0A4E9EMU2_GIBZA